MAKKGAAEKKPVDTKKGGKGASKGSDDAEDKGKVSRPFAMFTICVYQSERCGRVRAH